MLLLSPDAIRDWRQTWRRGGLATAQRIGRSGARRAAVARRAAGRKPVRVRAYWWDVVSNFGDQLNIDVLHHLGYAPHWSPANHSDLLPIGSLLEHIDSGYRGCIWGTGLMFDHHLRFPLATISAVRGLRTWENIGEPTGTALGDPGLLSARVYGPTQSLNKIALVPHFRHRENAVINRLAQEYPHDFHIVDVRKPPSEVARLIGGSRAVVSTSLHGIIVADSYGVPAAWWQPDPPLGGGIFKFQDYESLFIDESSRQHEISADMTALQIRDLCRVVPQATVNRICDQLVLALRKSLR